MICLYLYGKIIKFNFKKTKMTKKMS
jgi:hypothetical protein